MACNNSTQVYWAGTSFDTAPQFYSDASFNNIANDGWYSFNGIYRQMLNGILGPPTSCPDCSIPCGSPIKFITGGEGQGKYKVNIDLGTPGITGAVILRFNPSVNPSRLTWYYDGLSASEYSSATHGYKQDLIGEQDSPLNGGSHTCEQGLPVSNDLGSSNGILNSFQYSYDTNGGLFIMDLSSSNTPLSSTLGPYNPSTSSSSPTVNLVSGVPGFFTMVIPKPNLTPSILQLEVDVICPSSQFLIDINCPINLNTFDGGLVEGACGDTGTPFYTASVHIASGVSSTIAVNDWAFSDVNGVNQQPAGTYPVVIGVTNHFVEVDSNGVVTSVTPC
tara:strand:+ start:676 stop:1677 length:1002 start_codon:yes stop_codon:yes gene_type:complete